MIAVIAEMIDHNRVCLLRMLQEAQYPPRSPSWTAQQGGVPRRSYPYKQPTLDVIAHGLLNTKQTDSMLDARGSKMREIDK